MKSTVTAGWKRNAAALLLAVTSLAAVRESSCRAVRWRLRAGS
jgi:hypothetical protein